MPDTEKVPVSEKLDLDAMERDRQDGCRFSQEDIGKLIAAARRLERIQSDCGHRYDEAGECYYCGWDPKSKGGE